MLLNHFPQKIELKEIDIYIIMKLIFGMVNNDYCQHNKEKI